jgi:hypothetical protein
MNLIQIQEHLKDLPTQAIMSYANGQNPQVPPYMALGEMNRRKNMEQRAAQAPDSSVKEKLESELAQQVDLPGIGQGMNMRINPAGMPPPMPARQPQMAPQMPNMPIPPMARPTPPQPMSQPGATPGMAQGGLATLPVDSDMFNYAPGGIVAFADEDNNQLVLPPGTPYSPNESGTYSESELGSDKLPVGLASRILASRLRGDSGVPEVTDPEELRRKYIAEHPEQARLLNSLPGEKLTALVAALEEQNKSQRDRFKEGEGSRGLAALSNALIAAGEATRGQKGMGFGSALGGFGKSYNAATAATEDRAARQQSLERAQTIETMKLQSDIDNLQRAYAEGNVAKIAEYEKLVRAREEKISNIQGTAAKDTLTQEATLKQRAEQERHNKELEAYQKIQANAAAERAKYERENRPSKEDKNILTVMARLNADPDYKKMLDKRNEFSPGDPEFEAIQNYLDEKQRAAYKALKLTPPENLPRLKAPDKPVEEQGAFSKFLFGPKLKPSPVKPTEVPLPPGFKVVQ